MVNLETHQFDSYSKANRKQESHLKEYRREKSATVNKVCVKRMQTFECKITILECMLILLDERVEITISARTIN